MRGDNIVREEPPLCEPCALAISMTAAGVIWRFMFEYQSKGLPQTASVVQATVVASSAGLAEALAKSAVIRGSRAGLALLARAGAWAGLLLLEDGAVLASAGTSRWLD